MTAGMDDAVGPAAADGEGWKAWPGRTAAGPGSKGGSAPTGSRAARRLPAGLPETVGEGGEGLVAVGVVQRREERGALFQDGLAAGRHRVLGPGSVAVLSSVQCPRYRPEVLSQRGTAYPRVLLAWQLGHRAIMALG